MTSRNEVAMTVVDPGNRRWAQLLDLEWLVQDIIPLIIERIDLPDSLDYELLHIDSGKKLALKNSLASYGISAGDLLQISPVRNKLLGDLLDALYEQAVDAAAEGLWGQAEALWEQIRRLDPIYPDPRGVEAAIAARTTATATQTAKKSTTKPSKTGDPPTQSPPKQQAASSSQTAAPTTSKPASTSSQTSEAASGGRGCTWTSFLLLFLGGAVVLWAVNALFLDDAGGFELSGLPIIGSFFDGSDNQPGGTIQIENEPNLGTGDVQVTLRWDNEADVDLHVVDPEGSEIWYGNSIASSGGQLDVDANAGCGNDPAVENIFWERGEAPAGRYEVAVEYYGICGGSGPVNYEVVVTVDGEVIAVIPGRLEGPGESDLVTQFTR